MFWGYMAMLVIGLAVTAWIAWRKHQRWELALFNDRAHTSIQQWTARHPEWLA